MSRDTRTIKHCAVANLTVGMLWLVIAIDTHADLAYIMFGVWTFIANVNIAVWYHLRRKELAP